MASSELELKIVDALEAVAGEHGIDVVDVEVVGSSKVPIVRVRLDYADEESGPISLDEVSAQSPWVNEVIDAVDPFPGSYTLEISSPGLSRPLRKSRDYERFAGEKVVVKTTAPINGRGTYSGVLVGMNGDDIEVDCDGELFAIPFDAVKKANVKGTFDFN